MWVWDLISGTPLGKIISSSPVTKVAVALAWPTMRAVGYAQEKFLGLLPISERQKAALRLFTGPVPGPFMGGFLKGVAYPNESEFAEDWLSFFPEMLVPGTNAHRATFEMLQHARKGEILGMLDVLGDIFLEQKLEDPAVFVNGVVSVFENLETILGQPGSGTATAAVVGEFVRRLLGGEVFDPWALWEEVQARFRRRPGETDEDYRDRLGDELTETFEGLTLESRPLVRKVRAVLRFPELPAILSALKEKNWSEAGEKLLQIVRRGA